ncbi:MAG: hypothetical protein RL148_2494 [Planctomycetota bacterium]|jgi:exodeoxyribonuclease V beta subunit
MMQPFDVAASPLPARRTVLEASAGTGKTFTLEGLFVRHLLEGARPGGRVTSAQQVLVVTFTRASTQDLKHRLRTGLQDALHALKGGKASKDLWQQLANDHGAAGIPVLERALRDFDLVTINTIHGFCKRVLDRAAFASGTDFVTEFVEDDSELVMAACADALRAQAQGDDPLPAAVLRAAGIDEKALKERFDAWQLFPGTRIAPSQDLAPALESLRTAVAAAEEEFDAELVQQALADHKSNSKAPWYKRVGTFCERLARRIRRQPLTALDDLAHLSLANLVAGGEYSKGGSVAPEPGTVAHSFFLAAEQVADALEPARTALVEAMLHASLAALDRSKATARTRSFRDLLVELHTLVRDPVAGKDLCTAVREQWKVALVDECQDTDPLQYAIFDAFFGDSLLLVGDPKQSIYGFRGADLNAYLQAARASDQFTLEKNFRSHPGLVTSVIRLFQRGKDHPFVESGILVPEVTAHHKAGERELVGLPGRPMQWRVLRSEPRPDPKSKSRQQATFPKRNAWEPTLLDDLVAQCKALVTSGTTLSDTGKRLQHKDIAVLVRSGKEGQRVQDALAQAGITASIARLHDVFESEEAEELEVLMHAILDPGAGTLIQAARATVFWGRTASELTDPSTDASLKADLDLVHFLRSTWTRRGLMSMFMHAVEALGVRSRMLAREDGERKLTNWFQVAELLQEQQTLHGHGKAHLLRWFTAERSGATGKTASDRELRLESDAEAVQILTMHSSKGLQYEVVLLPYLTTGSHRPKKGLLLSRDAAGSPVLDLGNEPLPAHADAAERNQLGEDLRLLYVALTRAKRRCIAWHVPAEGAPKTALAWLLHFHHAGQKAEGWVKDWHKETKERGLAWGQDLEAFERAHAEILSVTHVDLREEEPPRRDPRPRVSAAALPSFRPVPERLTLGDRTASFSRLLHGSQHESAADHEDDRGETRVETEVPAESMFGFARGPSAGICLHAILEHADFRDPGGSTNATLIRDLLEGHGFLAPEVHQGITNPVAVVQQMLQVVTQPTCRQLGFALKDLAPTSRKDEWNFLLGTEHVDVREVGRILATSTSSHVAELGERIARKDDREAGYRHFVGKVDLMCRHQEKWWVFDWKSNHLGNSPADYATGRLTESMCEDKYVVQYHMYLAGLHCHLQSRIGKDYDYDRHVGGACYVYLRGLDATAQTGWYVHRPDHVLVDRLASALRGRRPVR